MTQTSAPSKWGRRSTVLAVSPDGTQLATRSRRRVIVWDLETGQQLWQADSAAGANKLSFSPDGTRLATASWDRTARLWDAASGEPLLIAEHSKPVTAVNFSPDGARLATASHKTARVWDATRATMLGRGSLVWLQRFGTRRPGVLQVIDGRLALVTKKRLGRWQERFSIPLNEARRNVQFFQIGKGSQFRINAAGKTWPLSIPTIPPPVQNDGLKR